MRRLLALLANLFWPRPSIDPAEYLASIDYWPIDYWSIDYWPSDDA